MTEATMRVAVLLGLLVFASACTNNPYPNADDDRKILYSAFTEAPKTLDPAVAYSTSDHIVTSPVYDTLLQYHFLDRPYRLIPGLLEEIPEARPIDNGHVVYRLKLRDGLLFQDDECFALGTPDAVTRPVQAADIAFTMMRLADPKVNSPVGPTFVRVVGFTEFTERLTKRREEDTAFAARRIDQQYAEVGGIAGVRVLGPLEVELELTEAYPQLRYWLAMEFTTPVPWEAIAWWNGQDGRDAFSEHPVGTGPYRLAVYDKRFRIVLEQNPNWYGIRFPDAKAPGTVYPSTGAPGDAEKGWLDPRWVGKPLPFVPRVELYLDKEDIPAFTKFLQGYYDASGIIEESFDRIVREGQLSEEMKTYDMRLEKAVQPSVYYVGFNMDDPVVGTKAGERGRKLRQAMSLVVDSEEFARIFMNGRGIPAQSPVPPGIFGYDADYVNPFRVVDPVRGATLLAEAGYPGGIDPATGQPLRLTFDTPDTSARGRLRFQFFVDAWRKLGIDVEISATTYNQFQDKVRRGAYQLFMWGWVADYPDPENFLGLLWGKLARSAGGPNTANFDDPEYDRLFIAMRDMEDGPERLALIRQMRAIVERESPWIDLFYPETYALIHGWVYNAKPLGMSFSTLKYRDVDATVRASKRLAWNEPIVWPAWALLAAAVVVIAPGVIGALRRRE
ncbi:MAG TPA: ABC transporter substrate-binding protein [Candidatus Binatia bacterium]|nr:ABC transporter substrate-binding protein [Candidatus Binatia bacterium]